MYLISVENSRELIVDCQGNILSVHVTCWLIREDGKPKYMMASLVPIEVTTKQTDPNRIEVVQ